MENVCNVFFTTIKKLKAYDMFVCILHAHSAPVLLSLFFLQHARHAPVQALTMLFPLSGMLSLGISAWLTALFPPNLPSVTDILVTLFKTYPYLSSSITSTNRKSKSPSSTLFLHIGLTTIPHTIFFTYCVYFFVCFPHKCINSKRVGILVCLLINPTT